MTGAPTENTEWLAGLRTASAATVAALRERLRVGLRAALTTRWAVDETDLEDLVQDATMRVLDRLDSFRGDSRFTTWAMAVAVHVALTTLRKRRWEARPLADLAAEPVAPLGESATALGDRAEMFAALRTAISDDLTPRQREVINAELAGTPTVVIAARFSTTPGAIYKLVHDARKKLRSALARRGFDADSIGRILAEGG